MDVFVVKLCVKQLPDWMVLLYKKKKSDCLMFYIGNLCQHNTGHL